VIQPHRMLQQAIALALFTEHDVQMSAAIPESLERDQFDAVIVDAASLRETTGISDEAMRRIRDWHLPTIWIGDKQSAEVSKWERLVMMERPIAKEGLHSALAECLGVSAGSHSNGVASTPEPVTKRISKKAVEENEIQSGATADPGIIELVDIIEEEPRRITTTETPKK